MDSRNDFIYLKLSGERYTPFSLAKKLGAKALLESANFSRGKDRYSILMTEEAFRVIQDDRGAAFVINGKRTDYTPRPDDRGAAGKGGKRAPDILDALAYIAGQNKDFQTQIFPHSGEAAVPFPASGIGYLGYEFCARCDSIRLAPQTDGLRIPEAEFMVGHVYLIFDHFSEEIHICALNYFEHEIDLREAVESLKKRLNDLDFSYLASPEEISPCTVITDIESSKKEYVEKVDALKRHIVAGDLLQAVPSRRLQFECKTEALEIYRKLRTVNPSPYLIYLDYGTHQLVGTSPESLIRVRNGVASIRPIAGTRRRGKNNAEDEKLKIELAEDPKERAEHLMLVDLARNDLGRVCAPGTVEVTRFMECEVFSHVIHLVSDVTGKLEDGVSAAEALRMAFPAGTVSGAPKIEAIEILSSLEKEKRSFYAGAVGYMNGDGLDFCITIRCALRQSGGKWTLQAGGGIVYDSNPEREWTETEEKLGAMGAVFGLAAKKNNDEGDGK